MATATIWLKQGKVIVDTQGKIILCDHCPCSKPSSSSSAAPISCESFPKTLSVSVYCSGDKTTYNNKLISCTTNTDGSYTLRYCALDTNLPPDEPDENKIISDSCVTIYCTAQGKFISGQGFHGPVNDDSSGAPCWYKLTWPLG